MNGLRLFLEAQGLSQKDIEEALEESRNVTRVVQAVSGKAVEVFIKLASKTTNPKLVKGLTVASMLLGKLEAGAGEMLGQSRVEASPPPCAPSTEKKV